MIKAIFLAFSFSVSLVFPVFSESRVALVIGNSGYEHVANLPNASNDASDIANALERIGFEVTLGENLGYRDMRLLLRDFARSADEADVVFVYFAGHGIEIENTNYLIPTNAQLRSDRDIEFEAVGLQTVIQAVGANQGLKIILVDACRNNPFLADMIRTSSTRSIGRGLARVDPGGVLVGYAARSGTLALDGDGRNSPYAKALLEHMEEPGLEVGKMFRKVRDRVYDLTGGYQEPFTYGSLPGKDIFLVPTAFPQSPADSMAEAFAEADRIGTLEAWRAFLEQFRTEPDHPLFKLAQTRTAALAAPPAERKALRDEPTTINDEIAAFGAAEMLGYPRAWALFFDQFPQGRMRRSALLQEDVALMDALRSRVWGRYRNVADGRSMTPEMQTAALEMIQISEEQVIRIQNTLSYREIDVGRIDGNLGPQTRRGLERFQSVLSLPVNGLPTRATLAALAQIGGWGSTGRLEYTPAIFPTSGAIARVLDAEAVRILEQDPRLDRALTAFARREVVYGYFDKKLYLATNLGTTYGRSELEAFEAQVGGRLVEINSQAEEAFLRELVRFDQKLWGTTSIRSSLGPAIGLSQKNGQWMWRSGAPLSYENWAAGEPRRQIETSALDSNFGRLVPIDRITPQKSRVNRIGWATSSSLSPVIILEIE